MGVQHGSKVLYTIKDINIEQLKSIATVLLELGQKERQISVAIDANWLGLQSGPIGAVQYASSAILMLLRHSFRVLVVFDPKERYLQRFLIP